MQIPAIPWRFVTFFGLLALLAGPAALGQSGRNLNVAAAGTAEQRVALVIGNAAYKEARLANSVNDATDMAAMLRSFGFKVILRTNASQRDMRNAVREFGTELRRAQVGLFFYAGHGVQVRGNNYLVPVAADIQNEADAEDLAVDAQYVLRTMEDAQVKVSIAILDACRNNPFSRGFRSVSRGLAQMSAATGSFIAFATAPGSVAADGIGRNGIYTKHLLASLRAEDADILKVFQRTRAGVVKETGGKQTPWESTSLVGDFYFRPGAAASSAASVPATNPAAIELAFWDSIKASTNPADFQEYLNQYRAGRFAGLARNRLRALASTQVATASSSTQATQPAPVEQGLQSLAAGSVFKDCDDCPEMVMIPAGSYDMGESPKPRITIARPFAVGKTEVTFAQWDACVAEGGCTNRLIDEGWGRGSQPVINANWDDAKQFVAWLSHKTGKTYRLLTEAEWEYAARAGTTTAYYWGDSDSDICQYASVNKDGNGGCGAWRTVPVASKKPNSFGLYDMLGNVREWLEDCWNGDIGGIPSDGSARTTGECGQRVLRGGSWEFNPRDARSAYRGRGTTTNRDYNSGFRVARTL